MRVLSRSAAAVAAALGIAALAGAASLSGRPAHAAEATLELKWHQLVPPARPAPKSFFSPRKDAQPVPGTPSTGGPPGAGPDGGSLPAPQAEGRWMSGPMAAGEAPAPVVAALDGKRVRIGGYVVSLDFDATKVKEFLLVPFVGACIHVPPPPANQIVYVKSDPGFEVTGQFDPVWVTGVLKASTAHTGLAEAGYSLVAEKVERRVKE
jgi:uncharacterized protein